MAVTVNVHQAKTHLSRLTERAHAAEQIILAKAGKPYALLEPLPPPPTTRRPGRLAGELAPRFSYRCPGPCWTTGRGS